MDIKQDPNSIPHYNGGGRLGEPDRNELEQSSVLLDTDAEDSTGDTPVGSGEDSALDSGSSATVSPQPAGQGAVAQPDPTRRGAGAIDGLVGAP